MKRAEIKKRLYKECCTPYTIGLGMLIGAVLAVLLTVL